MLRPLVLTATLTALTLTACTSMLDIDGEYSLATDGGETDAAGSGLGGRSSGGRSGSGSTTAQIGSGAALGTGAVSSLDAGPAEAGSAEAGDCGAGEKLCPVMGTPACVKPDPSVGCGPTGCSPCSQPPMNAYAVCTADAKCSFQCHDGYVKSGSRCIRSMTGSGGTAGSGGATGTGGATGGPTKCDPTQCKACGAFPGCCSLVSNQCGCLYVAWCQ